MSSSSDSSSSSSDSEVQTRKRKRTKDEAPPQPIAEDEEPIEDEPVVSHAEKRRNKKAEKAKAKAEQLAQKEGDAPPKKKVKLNEKSGKASKTNASEKKERQNSVWVGNISYYTTPEDLKGFFDGVGEITRINMPTKPGSKDTNMGFAYVDFASQDQKIIAISLSERDFQGRPLLIKDGDDFKGRPSKPTTTDGEEKDEAQGSSSGLSKWQQKILKDQKNPPSSSLFLGNLSFETTAEAIRSFFEVHRERRAADEDDGDKWLRKVRLGTFEDSGKCKGWAFADFTQTEYATDVLLNHRNHKMDGRQLNVEYASADAVRRGGGAAPSTNGATSFKPTNKRSQRKGPRQMRKEARAAKEAALREAGVPAPNPADLPPAPIRSGRQRGPKNEKQRKEPRTRAPPGAALAHAQRESTAIVPSSGNKIVF